MKKFILFFSLCAFYVSHAKAQIINTIAGNGYNAGTNNGGYSGNGGQATAAELSAPAGIVLDKSGNIYIADYANNVIRMVTKSTGIITTIAGNGYLAGTGNGGFSGDGGKATVAELFLPSDIALDTLGNIYITDYNNNRIRKVDTFGIITTIAGNGFGAYSGDGGQATSAEISQPEGLIFDHLGNLYIADAKNERVRRISASTWIITTIAGNGYSFGGYSGDGGQATDAEVNYPTGLGLDDSNNVFIADYYNNRIRKVMVSSGIIITIAGNGYGSQTGGGGYSGDGGQAKAAELYNPIDVKLDATGNIYIADPVNNRIRLIAASTGVITTIAGNGIPGYTGNGGPATSAELNYPDGIAFDATGNIYLADAGNNVIRKINSISGFEQVNNLYNISVFPNPSNGKFTIQSSVASWQLSVEIYNVTGEKVYSQIIRENKFGTSFTIDLKGQPNGVYLYRLLSEDGIHFSAGKLIVQ